MARLVYTMDALDPTKPSGIERRTVGLEQGQLDSLMHGQDRRKLKRLLLAKEVLDDPAAVYVDLKRPGTEDFLCYVGRPTRDYRSTEIELPAPPGMLFVVFVAPSGKLTDWRWEPAEDLPDIDGLGEDDPERFGTRIWPPPTT